MEARARFILALSDPLLEDGHMQWPLQLDRAVTVGFSKARGMMCLVELL
jgi:hypothetical protein